VVDDMEEYSHLVHVHLYTEPEAAARWILAHLRREELQELVCLSIWKRYIRADCEQV